MALATEVGLKMLQQALIVFFFLISGALALALNWIIWPFVYRLWRDQYRRLRHGK